MHQIPEDLTTLISDLESFLCDGLRAESLSKKAKEKKDAFIKRIKDIRSSYPQDFKEKREAEDSDEFEELDSNNEGGSLHSERTDKDEEATCDGAQQSPPIAAQDLTSVFKAGYLEKRRKDHSFFGTEWQKRWCALSNRTFYYYGSEKDKQQKGEFCIDGYTVKMNNTLRKDAKKDCCFEISAPDKRLYQFATASQKDAEDWVEQIQFVLRDLGSGIIPEDEEEQMWYDDVGNTATPPPAAPGMEGSYDDIYEELPEEDTPSPPKAKVEVVNKPAPRPAPVNKSTDYKNYYQCKWDCTGDHADELSFKRGDTIYILSKVCTENRATGFLGQTRGPAVTSTRCEYPADFVTPYVKVRGERGGATVPCLYNVSRIAAAGQCSSFPMTFDLNTSPILSPAPALQLPEDVKSRL